MILHLKTWPVTVAGLFLAAFGLGACTPAHPVAVATGHASQAPPVTSLEQSICKDAPVSGCHEISVGGRAYRYYFSPQGPSPTDGTALLVDLGGPGISLSAVLGPDYTTQLRKDLKPLVNGKALLLVEEPWVDGSSDTKCHSTATRFYTAARQFWRGPEASSVPPMQCPWGEGVYGWNRQTYRDVVQAILTEQHIHTLDMAALSFGAVRYSHVDDLVRTAALVRPAAAPGTPNEKVLHARAAAVWNTLAAQCGQCTGAETKTRVEDLLERYGGELGIAHRSVPLTDFDIASALVAEGIHPDSASPLAWNPARGKVHETAAATLSDSLWLRTGEQDISPALVAYIDEYCQAYPGAPDPADPVEDILSAPVRCYGRSSVAASRPRPVDCLIVGVNDTSAPAPLAETWQVRLGGTRINAGDVRHWFTDMQHCTRGRS